MSDEQFNTIRDIQACKTFATGITTYRCNKCDKFHDEMKKLDEERFINPDVWNISWNVNSQYIAAGGAGPVKYLSKPL